MATRALEKTFNAQKKRAVELRSGPFEDRLQRLARLQLWIEDHLSLIQDAVFADLRKPEMEVNLTEIYPVLTELRQAISRSRDWAFPEKVNSTAAFMSASASIHYEPRGVCLIISPWNYPFNLAVGPMISALAAGNTVILKPSEHSPNTSALLQTMAEEVFEPADVSVVNGDAAVARSLLELPFDHIFFTGSQETGKKVMTAAARHLSSVTLELGGKSPAIISASASPSEAAERIAWGKFVNAGQTCIAPDYAFVHKSLYDRFIKEFIFYTQKMYGGGGTDFQESGDFSRIISKHHYERLKGLLDEAIDRGAKVLFGGDASEDSLYLGPALITDVPEDCDLMKKEIFGPILPVLVYESLEEVISYINERPKPLASYLFGQDERTYEKVLKETSAGSLVYNDCLLQFGHPHLPFGGVNASGTGKAHGRFGFLAFSNQKAVVRQRLPMYKLVYPPYSAVQGKFINYLLKYL